jgi:enamine deaminase RidA (YjgF/YER057c/UK114 family)
VSVKEKLSALGLTLPTAAVPVAAYVPAVKSGNLVFTAGQLPVIDGKLVKEGKVGSDVTAEDAKELAQICALNALAAISLVADLDQIERVVRVGGFVNCAPGFIAIPGVVNGASELLIQVFGVANGKHARTAVGVAELPLNAPVEIELIVEINQLNGAQN